mgnify:CR=1 FL=1
MTDMLRDCLQRLPLIAILRGMKPEATTSATSGTRSANCAGVSNVMPLGGLETRGWVGSAE